MRMHSQKIVNQFTKSIITEKKRKNKVSTNQITNTLITASLNLAFVNESCKSTGQVSKSQVIYRKIWGKSPEEIQNCFQENTIRFLKLLKLFNRNRLFMISFDTTQEAFYGDLSKTKDKMYLHPGEIARESEYYYEYLTASITCNIQAKYILDGVIVPIGFYVEDYVQEITGFIIKHLSVEVILFDRGFNSWGVIYKLKKLHVNFLIFWKKRGDWYKKYFKNLDEGEILHIKREGIYNRDKTNCKVSSNFVLIKQLDYNDQKYDWIFATNLQKNTAASYVKRYKKRWGIETIYRITDKIRIYTTSTNRIIRYFLFMFTCFVYNIWRFFQMFLGGKFTLANHKTNMIIFMAKHGLIYPLHYDTFEKIAKKLFDL
jgi:hypothetical protein